MTNSELNNLWEKGDEKSFTLLFNELYQPLVAYLLQYADKTADAEDIAQNTFIKLWEKRNQINLTTSVKSYLYTSAYNRFVDNFRKEKKNKSYLEGLKHQALQLLVEEPEEDFQKKIKLIEKTVNDLPDRCKMIFKMHKQKGYSYKEVAEKLQISVKTVEAQMSIALKRIRKEFKEETDLLLILCFGRI
ncbi:RNA polymerase sigma-70 factor [Zunongwangia endophytica]|uniref:RNA polymerase sigma-70 factor n=1 Tax=Zunongwangia endophytica TaxID=1808945 RepID=A0ABV8HBK7_9FLAO|nr:RNA polymerase sigma-70 factor [Zunongwangia endophytica]MDN3593304.1 RNA polymerase sigma-70 factor [Zunongwangia endophytica]MDN3596924.1 RNA polymerase sigma-70 factor [Zunongwangia endophytica]MDN3596970.1 RNA polymerase sigma-70 factor [Zunongwangia endophytica]